MKFKTTLLLFSLLLAFNHLEAQSVDLSNGKIKLDGKEILSYDKGNANYEFTIYKLNTKEELVFIYQNNNQTPGNGQDDYLKINFLPLKLKMETSNTKATWKKTVAWLFKSGVLNANGELDQDKVKDFIDKYDEKITERTIRH